MHQNIIKVIGTMLFFVGIVILISSQSGITGNVIGDNVEGIGSVLSLVMIIGGMMIMVKKNLEVMIENDSVKEYCKVNMLDDPYNKNSQKAYERFSEVDELLKEHEDKPGLELLEDLERYASEYINLAVKMEGQISRNRFRLEADKFQRMTEELDRSKRLKHNAFIDQIRIVNRYLFKNYKPNEEVPYGGVFSLSPDILKNTEDRGNRKAIGDWAGYLLMGLYDNRS